MRRCEEEEMWSRCEDVWMSRCEDEKMWSEDEKMWKCEDVRMRRCEEVREDVKMWGCEDEKMWRGENVWQTPTIRRTLRSDALGKNHNEHQLRSCHMKNALRSDVVTVWQFSTQILSMLREAKNTRRTWVRDRCSTLRQLWLCYCCYKILQVYRWLPNWSC